MGKLIYCVACNKITNHRDKLDALKSGGSVCDECGVVNPYCRLIKPDDVMFNEKHSVSVMWVEWNEDKTFKKKYDDIELNRSLILGPFNSFFTWKTTTVTDILENKRGYVKFRTKNSLYELYYAVDYIDDKNDEDKIQEEMAS